MPATEPSSQPPDCATPCLGSAVHPRCWTPGAWPRGSTEPDHFSGLPFSLDPAGLNSLDLSTE
eukprot:4863364-Alexandrium_andersonii.AAC.1